MRFIINSFRKTSEDIAQKANPEELVTAAHPLSLSVN
jgi:hypothetical protein